MLLNPAMNACLTSFRANEHVPNDPRAVGAEVDVLVESRPERPAAPQAPSRVAFPAASRERIGPIKNKISATKAATRFSHAAHREARIPILHRLPKRPRLNRREKLAPTWMIPVI